MLGREAKGEAQIQFRSNKFINLHILILKFIVLKFKILISLSVLE